MARIMNVFYGADCLPYKDKERQVHYPIVSGSIFNGSSVVDKVRFYVKELGNVNDTTWVSNAKRADGLHGYKILEPTYDSELDEYYVELSLSQWYTTKKGDLYISLDGYQGGVDLVYDSENQVYTSVSGTPVIQATGVIKITISYSVQMSSNEGSLPTISVQEALGLVSTKLDKNSNVYIKVIDNISHIDTLNYKDYIKSGDIVYDKANSVYYVISGLYPNYTTTKIDFNFRAISIESATNNGKITMKVDGTHDIEIASYLENGYGALSIGANKLVLANELYAYGKGRFAGYLDVGGFLKLRDKIITNNNATYGFLLPDTTSFTDDETLTTKEYVQEYTYDKLVIDGKANITYVDSNFGHSLQVSVDSSTYVLTIDLVDKDNNVLSTQSVDLPLESIISSVQYYDTYTYGGTTYEKVIVITLETTDVPTIVPVGDLVSGLVSQTSVASQVYGTNSSGNQTTLTYSVSGGYDNRNTIVQRDSYGFIKQANSPASNDDVTNKSYVDGVASFMVAKVTTPSVLYGTDNVGSQTTYGIANTTTDIDYAMGE